MQPEEQTNVNVPATAFTRPPSIATMRQPDWWTPTNLNQALQLADLIAKSALVPKDYAGKPDNVLVAMQMGAELGLGPLAALQNIAVINGRPAVWGDAMLAICRGHADFVSIEETQDKGTETATCKVQRRGQPVTVQTFSVDDAKRAGLWGKQGPWTNYPRRMLQLRARGFALRDAFADALRGIAQAEEALDTPTQIDATVTASAPLRGMEALRTKVEAHPAAPAETTADVDPEPTAPAAPRKGKKPAAAKEPPTITASNDLPADAPDGSLHIHHELGIVYKRFAGNWMREDDPDVIRCAHAEIERRHLAGE